MHNQGNHTTFLLILPLKQSIGFNNILEFVRFFFSLKTNILMIYVKVKTRHLDIRHSGVND